MTAATAPLEGQALLKLCAENPKTPKGELARMAGYVGTNRNTGEPVIRVTSFTNALLKAKGVDLATGAAGTVKRLSYKTTVHKNGNILLGSRYVSGLGEMPEGQPFRIAYLEDEVGIKITPISESEAAEMGDDEDEDEDEDELENA
jgi:hypothetical protein